MTANLKKFSADYSIKDGSPRLRIINQLIYTIMKQKIQIEKNGHVYELINVKMYPKLSEETDCFSADLKRDGKKYTAVRNHGQGGCHVYYWHDPKNRADDFGGRLDGIVDDLITLHEEREYIRKHEKKGIVVKKTIEVMPGFSYPELSLMRYRLKGKWATLDEVKESSGTDWLRSEVESLKAQGYEVLNTNI